MKKLFRHLSFLLGSFILLWFILFVYHYYKTHYRFIINNKFSIIDYFGEGFYLIETKRKLDSQALVIASPIVWYCVTQDHIIGCVGEEISDKSESYIPHCQINGHFIINKSDSNTTNHLGSDAIDDFLKVNHAICDKVNIY